MSRARTPLARRSCAHRRAGASGASKARQRESRASGEWDARVSAGHDEPVVIPSILNQARQLVNHGRRRSRTSTSPAGKYVVVAKARALNTNPGLYHHRRDRPAYSASSAAGADSGHRGRDPLEQLLAVRVVHVFPKPGRIELNCTRATVQSVMALENVKITRDPGHHPPTGTSPPAHLPATASLSPG